MLLHIMSFNTQHCLNYITRQIDFDRMAQAIRECDADIIGLNEMRDEGTHPEYQAQVKILAEKLGYPYYYFAKAIDAGKGNPYGNGLISRYPLLSAETILVPDPERTDDLRYETRCLLKARIGAGNGLTVMVIHFGLVPSEQENAVATVMQHMEKENCILMGDFNVQPEHPVLSPIRGAFKDAADLFDQEKLSFPSDYPDRKIDYIFVSPDVTIQSADIPAIVASDHRPHTAVIDI